MDWSVFTALIPYILSFLISMSVSIYAFRRRRVPGAFAFGLVTATMASMTFGYIMEL